MAYRFFGEENFGFGVLVGRCAACAKENQTPPNLKALSNSLHPVGNPLANMAILVAGDAAKDRRVAFGRSTTCMSTIATVVKRRAMKIWGSPMRDRVHELGRGCHLV